MIEPTIKCPNRLAEIKLTESLVAPLIQTTREHASRKGANRGEFKDAVSMSELPPSIDTGQQGEY